MIDIEKVSKLTSFVDWLIQLKGLEKNLSDADVDGLIQEALNISGAQYSKEECDAATRDITCRYQIYTNPGQSILEDYEEEVVRDNCSVEYGSTNPHDDFMERLLSSQGK